MVFSSLSTLINSVNSSLNYILGHAWAKKDLQDYRKTHDMYESLYMASVFAVFTVAYILILPFIAIYTKGITDIPYIDVYLPILFVLVQLLSCSRATASRLITISGHARTTQKQSIIEAAINLISSIVLVNFLGIYGVLLGTIIALLYRTNDIIIYANLKVLNRMPWKTYKKVLVNLVVFSCVAFAVRYIQEAMMAHCDGYFDFICLGFLLLPASLLLYAITSFLTDKDIRGNCWIKKIKKQ